MITKKAEEKIKELVEEKIKELENLGYLGLNRALVQVKKELEIYYSCRDHKSDLHDKAIKELINKNKIQVGCGKNYLPEYINIDIFNPADLICDVREDGIPLPSNSVDFIFSEHFLEHIDFPISVNYFFSEAYRVLKRGGKMVVGVPDAGLAIKSYINKDEETLAKFKEDWYSKRNIYKDIDLGIDIVNLVIRDQEADEKYSAHFWGYDITKLSLLFKKHDFIHVKNWRFDIDIANQKRKFGSIYLQGEK